MVRVSNRIGNGSQYLDGWLYDGGHKLLFPNIHVPDRLDSVYGYTNVQWHPSERCSKRDHLASIRHSNVEYTDRNSHENRIIIRIIHRAVAVRMCWWSSAREWGLSMSEWTIMEWAELCCDCNLYWWSNTCE